jgi:glucokinase
VAEAVDMLAVTLSQIIALVDPQLIVVGGVTARNGGEPFLEALRKRVRAYTGALIERQVRIEHSVLGVESVAIGGVALALESMAE